MSNRVTKESVWKTADKLFSQGTIVTAEKIRKEIGYGSFTTIGKYVKEWKEQESNDEVSAKSYPIPHSIDEVFKGINQILWDAYCQKIELISDNERIAELEKENEELREKLQHAIEDSIRLEQLEKMWNEQNQRYQKAMEQQRADAIKIKELEDNIERICNY